MTYENIVNPLAYSDPKEILALMATMRELNPVAKIEPDGFRPFWALTKYDDIKFVEMNHKLFLAAPRTQLMPAEIEKVAQQKYGTVNGLESLVNMDGEKHRLHRDVTRDFFMPQNIMKLQDTIANQAKVFVDKMAALDGQCDFASDIAFYFPLRVMMSLIGIPEEDEATILLLTQQMFGYADEELSLDESGAKRESFSAIESLSAYFMKMVADRRAHPRDDIATLLANAEIDGKPMGALELISYFIIAATAGHDTTSATIAGGLQALIENPEQLAKLKENPDLLPSAVNEMVRWVCPVKHFVRTATEDVEIRDVLIKKGESVALLFWSACQDEEIFDRPDVFDIERKANKHLALGFGPHVCLGQHLARLEIKLFFQELLPRLVTAEIAGQPKMLQSNFVSGLKNLPLRYQMV